jgi:hypothetical protein
MPNIIWSDYLQYRAKLRGFELAKIEEIETGRLIAVGKHDNRLVIIPYEYDDNFITPVTIHATTRQQIRFRLTTGRYTIHE